MQTKFIYERKKFMELAGIKTKARFNQLISGYNRKLGKKDYFIKPVLEEGKDFRRESCRECGRETVYFTQGALNKVLANKK